MPPPNTEATVLSGVNPIEGKVVEVPSHDAIEEKLPASPYVIDAADDSDTDGAIIITGADAANYLLPLRNDGESALSFRSLFLASCLACFSTVMSQIYSFKRTVVTITGTFIALIAHFLGKAWANFLPRGDKLEALWRERSQPLPTWIKIVSFFNHGKWNLKEHAICAITALSASSASESITTFAAQDLFYDLPLSATTVVLTIISIGLFGYGICGIMRPIAVWHVEATLQGLHWQNLNSKPLRAFWFAFVAMFFYEFLPAYIFPWLNAVSIPCLASMKATGEKSRTLTNIFAHSAVGYPVCFIAMLTIYYTHTWDAKKLPFMSTRLLTQGGDMYPTSEVFVGGILDKKALEKYGIPRVTGTFAYAMFMTNTTIGALVAHCFLFWGGDIKRAFKSTREGRYDDRNHEHMAKTYKETPWWRFVIVLVVSFVLGIFVVTKENITLPVWAYVLALLLGIFIAPLSTILSSRYGKGIATNNLSKTLAGLMLPERPICNMYFASWSHSVIFNAYTVLDAVSGNRVTLSNDLKMGEYLKIPPRTMFLTQIYGTILGGFVNFAVMTSIVKNNRHLLVETDGNSSWSGANIQSYNTNATSWALAQGLLIGAIIVVLHRLFVHFVPKIRNFSTNDINMPQFIQYAGYIPYNQTQTCVLFSQLIAGFFVQFYLLNYKPRIFKDYSYLVKGAFDGASLFALFILSFAVFGAGGPTIPFPKWWGNNSGGHYDHCPMRE
ncbi:OPT oligopeptide transporter [Podospora fimiseda]|uniref:OPT oligopeptide transporter n=1 Tax=Podospora fimiseda TaxID=252190 RepID=A0AAN7BES4_9PEZI|nr:OPT oligopeptide transporter [Podospora fimiseda]